MRHFRIQDLGQHSGKAPIPFPPSKMSETIFPTIHYQRPTTPGFNGTCTMCLFFSFSSFFHFLGTKNDVKALSVGNCSDIWEKVPQRTLAFCTLFGAPVSRIVFLELRCACIFLRGKTPPHRDCTWSRPPQHQTGQLPYGSRTSDRGQRDSGGLAKSWLTCTKVWRKSRLFLNQA